MQDGKALVPIEEQTVDFYGDEITTALVRIEDRVQMYVPIRPICAYLGLAWSGQFERIQRDSVLSTKVRYIRLTRTRETGGNPESLCLPIEFLNGWLFGVSEGNTRKRERTIRDPVLSAEVAVVRVIRTTATGGIPDSLCLPIEFLNG